MHFLCELFRSRIIKFYVIWLKNVVFRLFAHSFRPRPPFNPIFSFSLKTHNGSCPDAELEKLTQYLNSTDRKAECTALKNVKLRMQMQGGDLQVSHGTLGGFGVSLRLPLHPAHSQNTEQQNGQPQKEETSHADTVACG